MLAEAAAKVEVYYLMQARVPNSDYAKYMGRCQWPEFRTVHVVRPQRKHEDRYASPEASWWATLAANLQLHGKLAGRFRGHDQTESLRVLIIAAVTEPQKVRQCWFAAAQQPGHEEEQAARD